MKLKEFLQENNYTQNKFIDAVQEETGHRFSQGGLAKYIIGVRIPRKKEMGVIHSFTKGEVSPNDFYL
tara:strand:+ start:750 stop:953 length:204 start_codon:yes stop_codon:yes gene_type:complete